MSNVIDWFEIPTLDLDRAVKFYEAMLGTRTRRAPGDGVPQALLLGDGGGPEGALIQDPRRRPTADGAIVYLRAKGGIDGCIERATRAGGQVVVPKTGIGEPGHIAIVADTEGNHVGLHMERS